MGSRKRIRRRRKRGTKKKNLKESTEEKKCAETGVDFRAF